MSRRMNASTSVLVVDDEPVVREAIRRVLEEEGMRVTLVSSGEEALRHETMEDCSLLLCDLMMPGLPGLEVIAAARARRPDLPIVAITGYATAEIASGAAAAGVTDFLPKPFDHAELLNRVRDVLCRDESDRIRVARKEGRS